MSNLANTLAAIDSTGEWYIYYMFPLEVKIKSGEIIVIRKAQKKDAASLIEYINDVAAETDFLTIGPSEFAETIKSEEEILEEHTKSPNRIFLVAELDGKIAGVLNVDASDKSRLRHIGDFGITVRKDHWGKGIGAGLIQSMLDWAKATGILRKINLRVQTNNIAAISLYKKFGFKQEGEIKRDTYIHGKFFDSYIMGILID